MSKATITLIDLPDGGTDIRLDCSEDEGRSTRIATSILEWMKKIAKDGEPAPPAPDRPATVWQRVRAWWSI